MKFNNVPYRPKKASTRPAPAAAGRGPQRAWCGLKEVNVMWLVRVYYLVRSKDWHFEDLALTKDVTRILWARRRRWSRWASADLSRACYVLLFQKAVTSLAF